MSKRIRKTKKNNKMLLIFLAILTVCLFVIYKFNFSTKSIKTNEIVKIPLMDLEAGKLIDKEIELEVDELGNTYIVLPEQVNDLYISQFFCKQVIEEVVEKEPQEPIEVVQEETTPVEETTQEETTVEETSEEVTTEESADIQDSEEVLQESQEVQEEPKEVETITPVTETETYTHEVTNAYRAGDKIYLSKEDIENGRIDISFEYKKVTINDTVLYYQLISKTDDNKKINVKGYMPKGYELAVEKIDQKDAEELISDVEEFENHGVLVAYDLTITNGTTNYQPKDYYQTVEVTFDDIKSDTAITPNTIEVLHVIEDEESKDIIFEKIDVDVAYDDTFTFRTDAFSKYITIETEEVKSGLGKNKDTDEKYDRYTVNDYAQDYNYYMGLNYTDNGGTYSNKYNDDNLARVTINYYSYDRINNKNYSSGDAEYDERRGNISPDEPYKKATYIHCVPVNNDSFTVDLIDNPFINFYYNHTTGMTAEQLNQAYCFGGWAACEEQTPSYTISSNSNTYAQKLTYNNVGGRKTIEINLWVNWTPANVVFLDTQDSTNPANARHDGTVNYPYRTMTECYNALKAKNFATNGNFSPREGNIVVLKNGGVFIADSAQSIPVTVTSVYNNIDYRDGGTYVMFKSARYDLAYDFQMHNVDVLYTEDTDHYNDIPGNDTAKTIDSHAINAQGHNLRLGRGIKDVRDDTTTFGTVAGYHVTSDKSISTAIEYRLVVESGKYNTVTVANACPTTSGKALNANGGYAATLILGNDIDRITNNNSKLKISTKVSSRSSNGSFKQLSADKYLFDMYVKSGTIGYDYFNKYKDHNEQAQRENTTYAGIYLGGFGTSSGYDTGHRRLTIEGGSVANIIGGLKLNGQTYKTNIYVKGGDVLSIVGGAGRSDTYGNRIIQVTDGQVITSVFGGSNGVFANANYTGTMYGDSIVYIGGNALIGKEDNITDTLFGATSGNVFASGNGNNSQPGCVQNGHVIIDGNATIYNSVYGGGNYATCGGTSSYSTDANKENNITTYIDIIGGTIKKNVYGGSNIKDNKGSINIRMYHGKVEGTIYGGCNQSGKVIGRSLIEIMGGSIGSDSSANAIFGGGFGSATEIVQKVYVNIHNNNDDIYINGNIYGGSSLGKVSSTTLIDVTQDDANNDLVIDGKLFAAGEGVAGNPATSAKDIVVNINKGSYPLLSVYGGGNINAKITGKSTINIGEKNSALVREIYCGGKKADIYLATTQITANIYEHAIVDYVYGGGNEAGSESNNTVSQSTINVIGGKVRYNIYGGSNSAGTMYKTTINLSNNATAQNIFGGGKGSDTVFGTDKTNGNIIINIKNSKVIKTDPNTGVVYGGSEQGTVQGNIAINLDNAETTKIYGGGKEGDVTGIPVITLSKGSRSSELYGGGQKGKINGSTSVKLEGFSTVANLYGGGELADVSDNTTITLDSSTIENVVYGGGKTANVNGKASIIAKNSSLISRIYGGGEYGNVTNTDINLGEESLIGDVFGGGNNGKVTGKATVVVDNSTVNGSVFGGGEYETVANSSVTLSNGTTVATVYGGGDLGNVTQDTLVTVNNSKVLGDVYGGGNGKPTGITTIGGVLGNATVDLNRATIEKGSVYGGGNGTTAKVNGNTHVIVQGTTSVYGSVFGGGNSSETGLTESKAISLVDIAGGTIGENVYGGANSSSINGKTVVNIGNAAIKKYNKKSYDLYVAGPIAIKGTIFGGGEMMTKASFDFDAISVSDTIAITVDASGYDVDKFTISGSIFGSGNSSNTKENGDVYIYNLGTKEKPNRMVSIQRANNVIIDKSVLRLNGTTDSTAFYANVPYSFSIVNNLILENSSTIYLRSNGNRVSNFYSLINGASLENLETVKVAADKMSVTRNNVDNRVYLYSGVNFNISPSDSLQSFGEVHGMAFLGIFTDEEISNGDGSVSYVYNKGMYDESYEANKVGQDLKWSERDFTRSYILGIHTVDYNKNGFYTVFEELDPSIDVRLGVEEANYKGKSYVDIIEPRPPKDTYYMWYVGPDEEIFYYSFNLTASKFSTLGTEELTLLSLSYPNATLVMDEFSTNLSEGVSIVDKSDIPSINENEKEANRKVGLEMKTGNNGWNMVGSSTFFSDEGGTYSGTKRYTFENSDTTPSLKFYLNHSNNITEKLELGYCTVKMKFYYWKDELNQGSATVLIDINLATEVLDEVGFNGAITPGVQYDLFTNTEANITRTSSFSSYFELAEPGFFENEAVIKHYDEAYRVISTGNFTFPQGTSITMVDKSVDGEPAYYYYNVTHDDQNENKRQFRLTEFTEVGSKDKKYDEDTIEKNYVKTIKNSSKEDVVYEYECFIFIVNFENADFTGYAKDAGEMFANSEIFRFSINYQDDKTGAEDSIAKLIDGQVQQNIYSIFDNEAKIEIEAGISAPKIYLGNTTFVNLKTVYGVIGYGGRTVYDSRYFDKKLGIKVSFFKKESEDSLAQVSGADLLGTYFELEGKKYYPRADGTIRIKLAELVSNSSSTMELNTENSSIPTGDYVIRIESFGSADGIYYGLYSSDQKDLEIKIVNDSYGLTSILPDNQAIIDAETGKTLNEEGRVSALSDNKLNFKLDYKSGLGNPYVTVSLYRRNYDKNHPYDTTYTKVDLQDYVRNKLETPQEILNQSFNVTDEDRIYMESFRTFDDEACEYKVFDTPFIKAKVFDPNKAVLLDNTFEMKNNIKTGTYKVVFSLYDAYEDIIRRPVVEEDGSLHYIEYKYQKYEKIGETFTYILIKANR